ncbi:hypothetical protein [Roseisolibacter sp. H3M3-2]|uniref:hypothetical protein n=1 Tax=Roseisolibacter sp. H3M3-2 TaxID=3031323 RepID=UPI0023DAA80C|nr:hypothetical protein [Roseisolibacter sp. H3M3-2]MDF1503403.1 hypothetical protein [Roseisolibacter sp. H3M3-2]
MIHHHIDLGSVLRGTVCALYSNLVTRPTGVAVRTEIERAIAEAGGRTVTVIDFSQVTLLDFSCADEIVAKLMLRSVEDAARAIEARAQEAREAGVPEGYFVFRGVCDRHLDAIEAVLERHGLAIVAQVDGRAQLVGEVAAEERAAWDRLCELGAADAEALGADAAPLLERLAARRLVMPVDGGWAAVGARLELPPEPGPARGRAA